MAEQFLLTLNKYKEEFQKHISEKTH